MENQKKHPYLLFISIIIAGILVAGAIMYKDDSAKGDQKASSEKKIFNVKKDNGEAEFKKDKKDVNIEGEGDDPMLGNPNAPVSMVVFGDFQCHFCRQFELETKPQIIEKYVKSGEVKIIARDFPFLGQDSLNMAVAANCAFEQNKYFEYSDALHKGQKEETIAPSNEEALVSLAEKLKLNITNFNECYNSEKYVDEIKNDFIDGRALGIEGTPTSFINGEILSGALPYQEFQKVIESSLSRN